MYVCYRRQNGSSCVRDGNECAWCATTQQCFAFVEYVPRFPFGGCRHWYDGVAALSSNDSADDCSRWSDCRSCLHHFMCGWCSHTHNPTIGSCYHGDFSGISTSVDICPNELHTPVYCTADVVSVKPVSYTHLTLPTKRIV